jgi:hypothetical protein
MGRLCPVTVNEASPMMRPRSRTSYVYFAAMSEITPLQ